MKFAQDGVGGVVAVTEGDGDCLGGEGGVDENEDEEEEEEEMEAREGERE